MNRPKLSLFGQPQLVQNGEVQELKSRKGWALLAYLALSPSPVSRELLATLFWPENEPVAARRNLRRLLYTLNQSAVQDYLVSDGETLTLNLPGEIDVQNFVSLIENGEWEPAVGLYRGELLDGVVIGDSNPFETWLTGQREQLRQQMLQALTALTDRYLASADYMNAEATVRRQLSLDNWNELLWQRLMTILAENGRRAQALSEFNNCRQVLKKELGVDPSEETVTLYESIRDGHFQAQAGATAEQHFAVPPPTAMPHATSRTALLGKMRSQWIDSVLAQSVGDAGGINLKKAAQPAALAYPWTTLIQRPETKRTLRPPSQTITEIFEAEGRGLLILGEPGAGKTTTLLTLAAELLERAAVDPAYPIPVILPLASWRGGQLGDWVARELNEKYRVLADHAEAWVRGNRLILLLDGLDELPTNDQAACVVAINQFREAQGLTPIAVSCRQADYDSLPEPLNLNGAVALQPLDAGQIESFLGEKFAQLQAVLKRERKLFSMAQSPLLLNLLTSVTGNLSAEELAGLAGDQSGLFGLYVKQQVDGEPGAGPAFLRSLKWLARQLEERNRSIFMLDRIQPDWLEKRGLIGFYYFLSRFIGAFVLALAWVFRDQGSESFGSALFFGFLIGFGELLYFFLFGRVRLPSSQWVDTGRLWRAVVMGGVVTLALFPIIGGLALVNGLIFGLFFGWRPPPDEAGEDIRLVEKLGWHWRTFGLGALLGLVLGGVVFFYNRANLYSAGTGLLSIVVLFSTFGGLLGQAISTKTRPNEGMRLSWRNGWFGGAIVGGVMLVSALTIELLRGASLISPVLVGLQYLVMAGLWYGGLDLINHFTLRGLLAASGRLPWRMVGFLEEASRRRLMVRGGSGYLFLHTELRRFLANQKDEG